MTFQWVARILLSPWLIFIQKAETNNPSGLGTNGTERKKENTLLSSTNSDQREPCFPAMPRSGI
ncbi:hypothetical protein I7I48_04710 [Histoplasma ohiense]|nr:hypothetical protein I7I48_04710 [Histoplasma ohiense (nom. inval.)]